MGDILQHQGFLHILEIISTKLIRCHYNNPLAGHFVIYKTYKLVVRKYY